MLKDGKLNPVDAFLQRARHLQRRRRQLERALLPFIGNAFWHGGRKMTNAETRLTDRHAPDWLWFDVHDFCNEARALQKERRRAEKSSPNRVREFRCAVAGLPGSVRFVQWRGLPLSPPQAHW